MPRARLTLKESPSTSYALDGDELIVGRSEDCDIRLPDRFVSRRQALFRLRDDGYELENLGANPIFVNGARIDRKLLSDTDVLTLGKTELVFKLEGMSEQRDLSPEAAAMEAMTVFLTVPETEPHGPRLLIIDPEGQTTVHPIAKDALLLGRGAEADVVLNHPTVSRRQGVIRKRNGGFSVRNVNARNPLALNGNLITEEHLYSGDMLTMGAFRLTFLSDRAEDARPALVESVVQHSASKPSRSWLAWVMLLAVVIGAGAFLGYERWYSPMKARQTFELALNEAGQLGYPQARDRLNTLLAGDLSGEAQEKVTAILSQRTLAEAKRLEGDGRPDDAKSLLAGYVAQYGVSGKSRTVQDLLDEYRFQSGKRDEAAGDSLAALREFSAISVESPLYAEGQTAVSRIWQSYQQQNTPKLPTAQLLEEAEAHFAAKRYTTPLGRNAYALYQSVLAMDPDNVLARQRIEEMKAFYRETGTRFYQQKNCQAALPYLERFLVIDPHDPDIRDKATSCAKSSSGKRYKPHVGRSPGPASTAVPPDTLKQLLEDPASGEPSR